MSGRSVLIVGASSGIGLATALALSTDGENLTLMARSPEGLDMAAQSCLKAGAADVCLVIGDVGREVDARAAVAAALENYGRIDAAILTATVMSYGRVEQTPPEIFTAVVDTAVHGSLYLAQALMPVYRQQSAGILVVVNSLLGSITVPQMGAYATAKWGQRALVRTLQQETRDLADVHVCLVSPGSTNTPIYEQAANYTGRGVRPPAPVQQPELTAAAIVTLTHRPRPHISVPVGPLNPLIISGFRLLPWIYDRLVGPLFRVAAHTRAAAPSEPGNVLGPVAARERIHGQWPQDAGK